MAKHKKPWVAVLLNLILPGLAYLYLDKRRIFGYLLISSFIIAFIDGFVFNPKFPPFTILTWVMTILFYLAFAYDAYSLAKESNKK